MNKSQVHKTVTESRKNYEIVAKLNVKKCKII